MGFPSFSMGLAVLSVCLGFAAGLFAPGSARAGVVNDLASGAVHEIVPADAECFHSAFDDSDNQLCPIRSYSTCAPGGEANLSVIVCGTLLAAEGGAHAHHQYWFRVVPDGGSVPGAPPSFVPIQIFAPDVFWDLKLRNGAFAMDAGAASASYKIRLRRDPVNDTSSRGATVAEEPILLATHGGVNGCLSIPTGVDDVVNLAIKCSLTASQIQQGKASPSLSAIVEVGRVYNVELAMDLNVQKRGSLQPFGIEVSGRNDENDPSGPIASENVMKWSSLVITVGSATTDLEAQIAELRDRLEQHSHRYLTGAGGGQNAVEISTGLPQFPDGNSSSDADVDGVADIYDACPDTRPGDPIDASGCSNGDFCASHVIKSLCQDADWRSDEGAKARDCRWQSRACHADER